MKQVFRLSLLAIASPFFLNCQGLSLGENTPQVPTSPIGQIIYSSSLAPSPVYLKGEVVQRAPFLQGGGYLLRDETGQIWVISAATLPETGDRVVLRGQPQQREIPLGKQDLGETYIKELERL
ncbi:MAG: hypothetical protein SW833_22035 [Cyanobacteriota bacterium]|nr:hypothetical protein [Cyanobacteriota bacterium]